MSHKKKVPSIPPVPATVDPNVRSILQALRDAVTTRMGLGKATMESSPTLQQLVDNNIIEVNTTTHGTVSDKWTLKEQPVDPSLIPNNDTVLPWHETFSDNNLSRAQADWGAVQYSNGEESIVNETGTPPGMGSTYVWQLGNNSGNDEVGRAWDRAFAFPLEDNVIYKMTWHVRKVSGHGGFYLGVAGLAADKSTFVNTSGSNALTGQHFCCASNYSPGDNAWHTKIGFICRTGGGATSTGASTIDAPDILHASAKYVCPVFFSNDASQTGKNQISYVSFERVDVAQLGVNIVDESGALVGDVDALNSSVVVGVGGAYTFTTDGSGTWPTTSHDVVCSFYRDGGSIATHTVRGSISGTSTITPSDISSTGETTTYSASSAGSFVTITITHTDSNQTAYVTYQALDVASGGSVGK